MKFVLATANPGKIKEMNEILSGLEVQVVTRDELGIKITIPETGTTFIENATLKAKKICEVAGLPAIADDSGLIVDALGGAPGVYSSSYGGEELSAIERCRYLLKMMENTELRAAKFVCSIVCAFPGGSLLTAYGDCIGEIAAEPRGPGGFGYDPVFLVEGTGRTMAELTAEEKNRISHRGKALREFAKLLPQILRKNGLVF